MAKDEHANANIQAPAASAPAGALPAEARLSQSWDECIEHFVVKTGYGIIAGGLASFILFRM